ncbi:unnamed protein product [Linum trigynum]|uniref:Uncharacterized protein n=1 Tax=Linum trigynum TaxID=586398 RepID=A0AAV2EQH0_9ROSI
MVSPPTAISVSSVSSFSTRSATNLKSDAINPDRKWNKHANSGSHGLLTLLTPPKQKFPSPSLTSTPKPAPCPSNTIASTLILKLPDGGGCHIASCRVLQLRSSQMNQMATMNCSRASIDPNSCNSQIHSSQVVPSSDSFRSNSDREDLGERVKSLWAR